MAADPRRGIVTPEAVLLEFEVAGIGSRALALIIDFLIQAAVLTALFIVFGGLMAAGLSTVAGGVVALVLSFVVVLGYPAGFEALWNGRTPGKAALGLRVVTIEGAPIRFRHAAIRTALGLVDFWLPPGGLTAVLVALFSARNQRLGDMVAGTFVMRERTAAGTPAAVMFRPPPGWEGFAASLDVGPLSPEQYGLVRSFLLRVNQLEPGARLALANRLAPAVAERIHHELVPGTHYELFLVSVAAAYQRRYAPPASPLPPPAWSQGPQPQPAQPQPGQGQPGEPHPASTRPSQPRPADRPLVARPEPPAPDFEPPA